MNDIWNKVFYNGQSEICGRQTAFKKFEVTSNFFKAVFHKFHFVHS